MRFFFNTGTYFNEANRRASSFDSTTPFPATAGSCAPRSCARSSPSTVYAPHYVLEYLPNGQPPRAAAQQYWLIPGLGDHHLGGPGLLVRLALSSSVHKQTKRI